MANVIDIPKIKVEVVTNIYDIETTMPISGEKLKKPSDIKKYITKINESKVYAAIQNSANSNSKLSSLFYECIALESLDLSGWTDLSSQKTMQSMFNGCINLKTLNLCGLDTSTITSMSSMFSGCNKLTELDLSTFNTSNVTSMSSMFSGCRSLAKIWVPSTFVATGVSSTSNKPFNKTTGHSGGTHVYTDATDAATQGWGTIHSNYIMHYNATHQDFENA